MHQKESLQVRLTIKTSFFCYTKLNYSIIGPIDENNFFEWEALIA